MKITNPKHLPSPTYLRPPKRGLRVGGSGFAQAGQITNKFQLTNSKTLKNCFGYLEIGVWDLFGICNLVFGI